MNWYEVTVDVRYAFALLLLSFVAALALGRIIRRIQGPREDGAWERATRSSEDFGPHTLGGSDSQRMAALDAEEHCRIAVEKGRVVP